MQVNTEQTDNISNKDTQTLNEKKSEAQPSLLSTSNNIASQETHKRRRRTYKEYEVKHFYD